MFIILARPASEDLTTRTECNINVVIKIVQSKHKPGLTPFFSLLFVCCDLT